MSLRADAFGRSWSDWRVVYSVSKLTEHIKSLLAADDLLSDVWLSGEVSNFKLHTSGHCYFTLRDQTSSIKAVIWRTTAARMALPRDGDAVVAHGYVSVYEPQGAYQLYVDHLETAGVGQLWMEFERLKKQLEEEGLFDPALKRPLPTAIPSRLGVVTSSTGAALRDILRTLSARFPLVEVILAPTLVQGDAAPPRIVDAIQALNRWSEDRGHLDAIILARGGGSIEDLWAFNDERVARAIRASRVPVIAGIGHETDFTIADFAADVRAPTPTGAATLAVPDARELAGALSAIVASAEARALNRLAELRTGLSSLAGRLSRVSPLTRLSGDRQRLDDLAHRAGLAFANDLAKTRERLEGQRLKLGALDPAGMLGRGYALVTTPAGAVVNSVTRVRAGDSIRVRVADGAFDASVSAERSNVEVLER